MELCPGGLRPPILKFSFQNPLSCNRKRHRTLRSNSTGVSDIGGYVRGVTELKRIFCFLPVFDRTSNICTLLTYLLTYKQARGSLSFIIRPHQFWYP